MDGTKNRGVSAIQLEQVRNPWRSTWELLELMEAAERIAAGEAGDERLVAMPKAPEPKKPATAPIFEEERRVAAGGLR